MSEPLTMSHQTTTERCDTPSPCHQCTSVVVEWEYNAMELILSRGKGLAPFMICAYIPGYGVHMEGLV